MDRVEAAAAAVCDDHGHRFSRVQTVRIFEKCIKQLNGKSWTAHGFTCTAMIITIIVPRDDILSRALRIAQVNSRSTKRDCVLTGGNLLYFVLTFTSPEWATIFHGGPCFGWSHRTFGPADTERPIDGLVPCVGRLSFWNAYKSILTSLMCPQFCFGEPTLNG